MSNMLARRYARIAGGQRINYEMMATSSKSDPALDVSWRFRTEILRAGSRGSALRHLAQRLSSSSTENHMANTALAILSATAFLEVILPWIVIWLSNAFLFDIPTWLVWPLLFVPPTLGLLTIFVRFAWVACVTHLPRSVAAKSKRGIFAILRHR